MPSKKLFVRDLRDIKRILSKFHFCSIGDLPFFINGLEKLVPYYTFITTGTRTNRIAPSNVKVLLARRPSDPILKSSAEVLKKPEIISSLKRFRVRPSLITYEFNQETVDICKRYGWDILGNRPDLKVWLENKANFPRILKEANICGPECSIIKPAKIDELHKKWKVPFVVQRITNDLNGKGTFFVNSVADLPAIKVACADDALVKVTRFVNGYSVNTSACVTRFGVLLARYLHQLVGVKDLIDIRGGYCGNDTFLSFHLNPDIESMLYDLTTRIGMVLHRYGFRGCYGIDFVVSEKGYPYPIELNPRFQTTTGLLNAVQLKMDGIPFLAFHILEHLEIPYQVDVENYNRTSIKIPLVDHSQMVIHQKQSEGAVRISLKPGIYEIKSGGLHYREAGFSIDDIKDKHSFLVTRLLEKGQLLPPNAMMHIVQFQQGILRDYCILTDFATEVCHLIRSTVVDG